MPFDRSASKTRWQALILASALVLPAFRSSEANAQTANPPEAPKARGSAQAAAQEHDNTDERVAEGEEILVLGDAPAVLHGPGATQYDVRENLQGRTGSAADLLNTLPSVTVTSDGELSVRGRTDVEILIDGRPAAAMNGGSRGTTLQTIPGSSIESVEIITNPSVGVRSRGSAVINLKLRQDPSLGPRAAIATDIDHRRRGRVSLDSSYGWRSVKLDFDASYREDLRLDGVFTSRRYNDPLPGGIALSTILAEYTPTRSHAGNAQGKLRYTAGHTELGGSLGYTRYAASNIVHFFSQDYDTAGGLLDRFTRVRDARLTKDDADASLYLTRSGIRGDGKLTVDGQYGTGRSRSDRTYSLIPDRAASPVGLTYVGDHQDYSFYRASAGFEGEIASRLSLKAGATWESADERFRNGAADLPLTAPFPFGFVGIADDFRVTADELAAHVEATFEPTDWTIKGGLNWRGSTLDLANGDEPPFLERRFDGIDTSVSLEHDLSHGKLSLSLSRLVQLPEAQALNPAVIVIDVQDRYVGNPALRPQKALRSELQYVTTLAGMKAAATLYYRGTEDTIAYVYELVEADAIQSSRINAGLSQEYGAEGSLSGKLGPTLQFDLSGNVHRAQSSFTAFGAGQRDSLVTYSAKAALNWSLGERDKLRLDARADGPSLLVQGRRSAGHAVSLVWQHTIVPDLSFTLAAQQFIQNAFLVTDVTSPTVDTIARRRNNTTAIQLGINYKLR
jgi:hypothetical protein